MRQVGRQAEDTEWSAITGTTNVCENMVERWERKRSRVVCAQ